MNLKNNFKKDLVCFFLLILSLILYENSLMIRCPYIKELTKCLSWYKNEIHLIIGSIIATCVI